MNVNNRYENLYLCDKLFKLLNDFSEQNNYPFTIKNSKVC